MNTKIIEAAKEAGFLIGGSGNIYIGNIILNKELTKFAELLQSQSEPVAEVRCRNGEVFGFIGSRVFRDMLPLGTKLFTHPPLSVNEQDKADADEYTERYIHAINYASIVIKELMNEIESISAQPTPSQSVVDERAEFEKEFKSSDLIYYDEIDNVYKATSYHHSVLSSHRQMYWEGWEGWQRRAQLNTKPTNDALDADIIGLLASRKIMNILHEVNATFTTTGGKPQLQARIQCAVIDAINSAMKEVKNAR